MIIKIIENIWKKDANARMEFVPENEAERHQLTYIKQRLDQQTAPYVFWGFKDASLLVQLDKFGDGAGSSLGGIP